MTVQLEDVATSLDTLLRLSEIPDYPNAVNGVQFGHRGPIVGVASAVDISARTIRDAALLGANLMLVHHGLFWGGLQSGVPVRHDRVRLLLEHDMAVYSAHLPLDVHATLGNSRLLAECLGLSVSGGFARFQDVACGVYGECDQNTADLIETVGHFAAGFSGRVMVSEFQPDHRTRRWAICSGAGAGTDTIAEAAALKIDTLIVGEGPHWTAVDAPEQQLVIVYAGHYATETLGVRALGRHVSETFDIPHHFIVAPTGL